MSTGTELMRCHKILSLKRRVEVVKAFSPGSVVMTLTLVQPSRVCLFKDISDLTEVKRTYLSEGQSLSASFGRSRQHSMKKYNGGMLGSCIFSGSNIILDISLRQTSIRPTKKDQTCASNSQDK